MESASRLVAVTVVLPAAMALTAGARQLEGQSKQRQQTGCELTLKATGWNERAALVLRWRLRCGRKLPSGTVLVRDAYLSAAI